MCGCMAAQVKFRVCRLSLQLPMLNGCPVCHDVAEGGMRKCGTIYINMSESYLLFFISNHTHGSNSELTMMYSCRNSHIVIRAVHLVNVSLTVLDGWHSTIHRLSNSICEPTTKIRRGASTSSLNHTMQRHVQFFSPHGFLKWVDSRYTVHVRVHSVV